MTSPEPDVLNQWWYEGLRDGGPIVENGRYLILNVLLRDLSEFDKEQGHRVVAKCATEEIAVNIVMQHHLWIKKPVDRVRNVGMGGYKPDPASRGSCSFHDHCPHQAVAKTREHFLCMEAVASHLERGIAFDML